MDKDQPTDASRGALFERKGFLSLPRNIRDRIYRHALTVTHPLYLFRDVSDLVELFAPDVPKQWTALLKTNRQISSESSTILYTYNKFALLDQGEQQSELLHRFLERIGSTKCHLLRSLCIDFPSFRSEHGTIGLEPHVLRSLQLISERCTGLVTLELNFNNSSKRNLLSIIGDDVDALTVSFSSLIDKFKSITTLQNVVVLVHGNSVVGTVKAAMQGMDWQIVSNNGTGR
ncbi:hypothetical protein CAC42_8172 [Sphaceloma murrayae]|uniref:Uncharacterized protein n=1 Tax=Sphaceloma murrayae TaxID=2082308 RepID=A0A2K1QJP0_9PEZI|nr:hypothetical protein CAC42_8172 [Sphaceloma murrayae]